MDYYDILEVSEDASQDDIKRKYQQLALKHHPDKNPQSTDSSTFHAIDEAYRILRSPESRKEYDSKRFQSNQAQVIIHDTVQRQEFLYDDTNEVHYHVCKCGGWYILDEELKDENEFIICCDECSLVVKVVKNKEKNS